MADQQSVDPPRPAHPRCTRQPWARVNRRADRYRCDHPAGPGDGRRRPYPTHNGSSRTVAL